MKDTMIKATKNNLLLILLVPSFACSMEQIEHDAQLLLLLGSGQKPPQSPSNKINTKPANQAPLALTAQVLLAASSATASRAYDAPAQITAGTTNPSSSLARKRKYKKRTVCTHKGCLEEFDSTYHMKRHLQVHTKKDTLFICQPCDAYYKADAGLAKHNARYHPNESTSKPASKKIKAEKSEAPAAAADHSSTLPATSSSSSNMFEDSTAFTLSIPSSSTSSQAQPAALTSSSACTSDSPLASASGSTNTQEKKPKTYCCAAPNCIENVYENQKDLTKHRKTHTQSNGIWHCAQCNTYYGKEMTLTLHQFKHAESLSCAGATSAPTPASSSSSSSSSAAAQK